MPIKVKTPIEKVIRLTTSDPTEETYVTIRQATQQVVDSLEDFRNDGTQYSYNDAERGVVKVNPGKGAAEVRRMQVFWTMCDCNILGSDDKPLFQVVNDGKHTHLVGDPAAFKAQWGQLDPLVADEIFAAVLSVNPQWAVSSGE
jgi:hypothetical protein